MARRFRNTRRENRLEELGRVDAEKAYTSKGKRNLREEKSRIRKELKSGGQPIPKGAEIIGKIKKPKPGSRDSGKRRSGSPGRTPIDPKQKRQPRGAGPSAASKQRKKTKTHGGGPDSGNIGKIKDLISKQQGLGKKVSKPDLSKLKKRMPKYMKPLRKGGSAKGPNRPRPTGPHMWVRGEKRKKYAVGGSISKILGRVGKEIKKQPLPKKTKDLNKKFKKAFPGHDSKGKLKTTRPGYSSGGVVMAGKKVGCQIK